MTADSTPTGIVYTVTDGSAGQEYTINFPYIAAADVKAYYLPAGAKRTDTVQLTLGTDYSVSEQVLTASIAIPVGASLAIYRETPLTQEILWVEGQAIHAPSIMKADDKLTFIIQEIAEDVNRAVKISADEEAGGTTPDDLLQSIYGARDEATAEANRSATEADRSATEADRAATEADNATANGAAQVELAKAQVAIATSEADRSETAQAAAQTAQQSAQTQAQAAANSAAQSANSATASAASATQSASSASLAQKWAENPEDTPVIPNSYSAYHWARKAAENSGYFVFNQVDPATETLVTEPNGVNPASVADTVDGLILDIDVGDYALTLSGELVDGQSSVALYKGTTMPAANYSGELYGAIYNTAQSVWEGSGVIGTYAFADVKYAAWSEAELPTSGISEGSLAIVPTGGNADYIDFYAYDGGWVYKNTAAASQSGKLYYVSVDAFRQGPEFVVVGANAWVPVTVNTPADIPQYPNSATPIAYTATTVGNGFPEWQYVKNLPIDNLAMFNLAKPFDPERTVYYWLEGSWHIFGVGSGGGTVDTVNGIGADADKNVQLLYENTEADYTAKKASGDIPPQSLNIITDLNVLSGLPIKVQPLPGTVALRGAGGEVKAGTPSAAEDVVRKAELTYSLSEVDTGKTWVDGKKIYRKVVDCGAITTAGTRTIAHNISNIQDIISQTGFAYNSSTANMVPLPYPNTVHPATIQLYASAIHIVIVTSIDWSISKSYVIFEYTCTDR